VPEKPRNRELLYCWVAGGFAVLVPKMRGDGFLKVPYGHHVDAGLDRIGDKVQCDVTGLDGALDFRCSGSIYHGGTMMRKEFSDVVVPALASHYSTSAREITEQEFWRLHPVAPQ
jgi:hypothetical protein